MYTVVSAAMGWFYALQDVGEAKGCGKYDFWENKQSGHMWICGRTGCSAIQIIAAVYQRDIFQMVPSMREAYTSPVTGSTSKPLTSLTPRGRVAISSGPSARVMVTMPRRLPA